jgi:hypothetical protein
MPGVLLLYYLPGHTFNNIILQDKELAKRWYTRLPLDISSSVFVNYTAYSIFKSLVEYDKYKFFILVWVVNLFFWLLNYLVRRKTQDVIILREMKRNAFLISLILIPIFFFSN